MLVFDAFSKGFAVFAANQLQTLLETKHLYQKVSIQPTELTSRVIAKQANSNYILGEIQKGLEGRLTLTDKPTFSGANNVQMYLCVKNVKIYCHSCGGREAFRPSLFSDITFDLVTRNRIQQSVNVENFKINFPIDFQLFVLVYQCQRCETLPNVFLVRRAGTDLFLEGRSPIEHVELPNFIPKPELKWFRDGTIAFQTGKILAALFYLRTFIEQFARRQTNTLGQKLTGDQILADYSGTLPENLRGSMPSLGECYDKLSAAIHSANEDAELFEAARQKIVEHFDIRRVHKLAG